MKVKDLKNKLLDDVDSDDEENKYEEYNLLLRSSNIISEESQVIWFNNDNSDIQICILKLKNKYMGFILIYVHNCFGSWVEQINIINNDLIYIISQLKDYIQEEINKINHFLESNMDWKDYLNSSISISHYIGSHNVYNLLPLINEFEEKTYKKIIKFIEYNYWRVNGFKEKLEKNRMHPENLYLKNIVNNFD